MPNAHQHTLIFDHCDSGHHEEFLKHIHSYIGNQSNESYYTFLTSESTAKKLSREKSLGYARIQIRSVPNKINTFTSNHSPLLKEIFEYIIQVASEVSANHITFLYINPFQKHLLRYKGPYTYSGVILHPVSRSQWTLKSLIPNLAKWLMLWKLSLSRQSTCFHILNDKKSVAVLNRRFCCSKFSYLPDPIPHRSEDAKAYEKAEQRAVNRVKLLVFGALSSRKGIFNILNSLPSIPRKQRNKIYIKFVGRVDKSEKESFVSKLSQTKSLFPECEVELLDQFIEESEIEGFFDWCDWVLMPYTYSLGSSGLLGHAAYFNKPVIGPNVGLIPEIISEYSLGLTVDPSTGIAEGITKALKGKQLDKTKRLQYINNHSADAFSTKVLNQ